MSDTAQASIRLARFSTTSILALRAALALSLSAALGCGSGDDPESMQPFVPGTPDAPGDDVDGTTGDGQGEPPAGEPSAPSPDPEVVGGEVGLDTPAPPTEGEPPAEEPPAEPPIEPPPVLMPVLCDPLENTGARDDGDINVDLATEFQTISGFGGMNMPRWIADLTPEQAETAFGTGPGQLGLSMLRIGISADPEDFAVELPTAQRAVARGVKVIGTPWSPPPNLKTNQSIVAGELARANYGAYADHLMSFVNFMGDNGVPIEAISIQNEPDIEVDYDSCFWSPQQLIDFLIEQGPRFGDIRLMAPESFNFNRQRTDPLLNDAQAAAQFDIVAGHIYGAGLADYPLARERGKEVWMTEHYTDSGPEPDRANQWPLAYNVATELHQSMQANFNAYVWWYIRRGYGLITDDSQVSKRGYLMSQYSRFIRPGFVRVGASTPSVNGVQVTAYKNGPGQVVIVALNTTAQPQTVDLDLFGSCVTAFDRFTTSATKDVESDGVVTLDGRRASVTLDAQSLTTFTSQAIAP